MNNLTPGWESTSRESLMPTLRSASNLPTSAISPALSATAARLGQIAFSLDGSYIYFASIQASDPVTFTARSEMKIRIGLPFAVPR